MIPRVWPHSSIAARAHDTGIWLCKRANGCAGSWGNLDAVRAKNNKNLDLSVPARSDYGIQAVYGL